MMTATKEFPLREGRGGKEPVNIATPEEMPLTLSDFPEKTPGIACVRPLGCRA